MVRAANIKLCSREVIASPVGSGSSDRGLSVQALVSDAAQLVREKLLRSNNEPNACCGV
jgi:hypothetical protein